MPSLPRQTIQNHDCRRDAGAPVLDPRPEGGRAARRGRASHCLDADRQSRRHLAAGAGDARGGRRGAGRGQPRLAQAADPLRHQGADPALSRAQRRRDAPESAGTPQGRRIAGADFATRERRWSPIPASSWCATASDDGLRRDRHPRRLGGADRAGARRTADRPLLLRGLPAAEERGAADAGGGR